MWEGLNKLLWSTWSWRADHLKAVVPRGRNECWCYDWRRLVSEVESGLNGDIVDACFLIRKGKNQRKDGGVAVGGVELAVIARDTYSHARRTDERKGPLWC